MKDVLSLLVAETEEGEVWRTVSLVVVFFEVFLLSLDFYVDGFVHS